MNKYAIAYPYAKAIFEIASVDNKLQQWSFILRDLSILGSDRLFIDLINNPLATVSVIESVLLNIVGESVGQFGKNFVHIMIFNKRLDIFSQLSEIYEQFYTECQNIVSVEAFSALAINLEQQSKLKYALQKKFKKTVDLHCEVDKNLLGGLLIRIGDVVIDGSLRNKLDRFKKNLLSI